jgi:hypothetical protein
MFLPVCPLVEGRQLGWAGWSIALLGCSVPAFGVFAVHQLSRRRYGKSPLVELRVFAKRSYSSGVVFVLVFFGSVVGISLSIGLFLQIGLGYTPAHASITSATWAIGAFLGTGVSAGLAPKLGRTVLHIGLTVMLAGLAGVYLVLSHTHEALSGWALAGPLLAYGAGMGMIFLPLYDIIIADVGPRSGVGGRSARGNPAARRVTRRRRAGDDLLQRHGLRRRRSPRRLAARRGGHHPQHDRRDRGGLRPWLPAAA